jgi:hypothetical protein
MLFLLCVTDCFYVLSITDCFYYMCITGFFWIEDPAGQEEYRYKKFFEAHLDQTSIYGIVITLHCIGCHRGTFHILIFFHQVQVNLANKDKLGSYLYSS